MATTPVKTANDWLKVLASAGKRVADEVPPGFKTVAQIAKETGKSNSQTNKHLREAVKLGLVETRKFNVPAGEKLYPTPHFRICNSPKRSA
jgi:predicted transcriptional regulator